jgi:hypothetical protein
MFGEFNIEIHNCTRMLEFACLILKHFRGYTPGPPWQGQPSLHPPLARRSRECGALRPRFRDSKHL